jgi:hypothetical protein
MKLWPILIMFVALSGAILLAFWPHIQEWRASRRRHRVRSEASKRAWVTRRRNLEKLDYKREQGDVK